MASKNRQNTSQDEKTGDGKESLSKKKMTPEQQSARFIETARDLECDESGRLFDKAMRSIGNNIIEK